MVERNGDEIDDLTVDVDETLRERTHDTDTEEIRVNCTSRCISCKSFQCAKGKHIEGNEKCRCDPDKCQNKTAIETDADKFSHYKQKSFVPVDTSFNDNTYGSNDSIFTLSDTPYQVFMKLLGKEIIEHIRHQSHLYLNYNEEFKDEQRQLKNYYKELKKWNKAQRASISNSNIRTISAEDARLRKKRRTTQTSNNAAQTMSQAKRRFTSPTLTQIVRDISVTHMPQAPDNSQSANVELSENEANHNTNQVSRPNKPIIVGFNDWKNGRTPSGKGPFEGDKFGRYIQVLCAIGMNTIKGGF